MARRGVEADPFLRALRELRESGACGGLGSVSSVRLRSLSGRPAHVHTRHPDAAGPTQTSSRPAIARWKRRKMGHAVESLTSKYRWGILDSEESTPSFSQGWPCLRPLGEDAEPRRTRSGLGCAPLLPELPPQCSQSEPPPG